MGTELKDTGISAEVLADLEDAARFAASGIRDSAIMGQACKRMDRMREELRDQAGEMDAAVDLIREVRDEA